MKKKQTEQPEPEFDWENATLEESIQEIVNRGMWNGPPWEGPKGTADTSGGRASGQRPRKQRRRVKAQAPRLIAAG